MRTISISIPIYGLGVFGGGSYFLAGSRIKKSIEFGVNYQRVLNEPSVVVNSITGQPLIDLNRSLLELKAGMTYYFETPRSYRWLVMFTGSYALNKKDSRMPLKLTPYTFSLGAGIDF